MLNVLHVVLGLEIGGLEKFVLDLISQQEDLVFPTILCLEKNGLAGKFLENVQVIELNKKPGFDFWISFTIAKIVKQLEIDLIHTHNPSPHFYGALAGFITRTPVVHTKHGRNYPRDKKKVFLNKISSLITDRVVAVSSDAKNVCIDIEKINSRKVLTILNGIDTNRFCPLRRDGYLQNTFNIPDGRKIIGIVARLSSEKDHATLLRAFQAVISKADEFHLLVVGDGPLRQTLESLSNDLNIADHVTFTGMRSDVPELVRNLDLFVLTSTTEGISLTLLEAMSCGIPVVATCVGGNPEVVADTQTGFLVPSGDPAALASKIIELMNNSGLCVKLGTAGRQRVLDKFSISKAADQYYKLYCELLKN